MKVSKIHNQSDTDWADTLYKNSIEKTASINVTSGKVSCPMSGNAISTLNCEACGHCAGFGLKMASSEEFVKCSYKYDNMQTDEKDSLDKFVSKEPQELSEEITPDFFKSMFAKSERKFEIEEDLLSHKIAKSGNEVEPGSGTANFTPQNSVSIFDNEALEKFAEAELAKETDRKEAIAQKEAEKAEMRHGWDKERAEELKEINYQPKGIKSISHEAEASNPQVADHKFSVFENIDEKLKALPSETEGEKFKSDALERKASISRDKKDNDWENMERKNTTTKGIVSGFFDSLFNEKGE